jgi:hypothetical protein
MGEGETFKEAVQVFGDNVIDFADFLDDLVERDEATDAEREIFALLNRRLLKGYRRHIRIEMKRRRTIQVRRNRRVARWTPKNYSAALHA